MLLDVLSEAKSHDFSLACNETAVDLRGTGKHGKKRQIVISVNSYVVAFLVFSFNTSSQKEMFPFNATSGSLTTSLIALDKPSSKTLLFCCPLAAAWNCVPS